MAAGYDGSIKIDTSINSTGFNKGISGIMSGLKGIAAAVGIAFGIGVIVNFMKSCAAAASAMEILRNKFRGVFGAEANYAYQQLTVLGAKINMTVDDLMSLAATLQNTFVALGFGGMQAADLSIQLTTLTEDLATFYGVSDTEMAQTLVMALQGMTRGLKALGISINETDIKNKAMTLGLYNGVGVVSEMARAQAILALITDKTAAAQGNAEKTAHTWAGEIRGLVGAWGQFKVAFGNILIVFAPVIAFLSRIVNWLTTMVTYFGMVMSLLFNIKIDIGAVTGGLDDAAVSAGDLADNTNAAGKAAKGALASFDELNVLQQDQGTGGGVTPPGGGFTVPSLTIPPIDTSELDKMREKAKIAADLITEYWKHPWETIKRWAKECWDDIALLAGMAWTIIKQVWGIAMSWMYDHVTKPIEHSFLTAWENIKGFAKNCWDWIVGVWEGAMDWMYQHVTLPIEHLFHGSGLFDDIQGWATDCWNWIVGVFTSAATWFHDNVTEPVTNWFKQAWIDIKGFFSGAWTTISTAWSTVALWFSTNVITPLSTFFSTAWTNIKGFFSGAWTAISTAWATVATWFSTNVTTPMTNWFRQTWIDIKGFFSEAWTTISTAWVSVGAWFQTNVIDPLTNGFGTALDWIEDKFNTIFGDIKGIARGILNDIIGFVNTMIGKIVDAINGLFSLVNGLKIPGLPKLNPITAPVIPGLATGAIIPPNAAFAAILGDQRSGRNLEAPESLIRQIVREETQNNGDIHIHFDGTMGELIRLMKPHIDRENNRIGKSLISGVTS